ncbi:MAG: type III-A CRISPR-associated RAMP protein Csm4 [Desulfobacterales bacterium]|nr:type III-A CRISPR-associated RAMP protein Csm4 [Desulfobacterales bacterium]
MRIFKLKFHSGLHVDSKGSGEPEIADDFIRSDTLSAALCLAWSAIFPDTGKEFFKLPRFKVSSAFPYIRDIRLFPVPVWPVWKKPDPARQKELRKIQWISEGIYNQVLDGKEISCTSIFEVSGNAAITAEEKKACPEINESPAWVLTERQRVSVDRMGAKQEGGLFFFALQFFAPDSGLWFMAEADTQDYRKLRSALDYLGDTGVGADRNSGLGHFAVIAEQEFQVSQKGEQGWTTLSLFNPGPDENLDNMIQNAAYGLTTRSGWVNNTTVGRPPIRAFTEGSYFSEKPGGRVVEMLPIEIREKYKLSVNHSSPRDFRAISLPCAKPLCLKERDYECET